MRYEHFETLRPICPACRIAGREAPLAIADRVREDGLGLVEGRLTCGDPACGREYPVVDGVPVLVPDVAGYLQVHAAELLYRDDLGDAVAGIVGDALGQDTAFDGIRGMLATYGSCQFGDLQRAGCGEAAGTASVVRALAALDGGRTPAPALDVGCALGRGALELAQLGGGLALGVDLDLALLRAGQRMLREGVLRYPRRRGGLVYETRTVPLPDGAGAQVDLWACDAAALPFADGTFGRVAALNALDSVEAPIGLLREAGRTLAPAGRLWLTTPFEWLERVTPRAAWIGGHSARGDHGGDGDSLLRALLTPGAHHQSIPGLRLVAERDGVPWRVRLHDRRVDTFELLLLIAEAGGADDAG